jgi:hypothetical protein
MNNLKVKIAIVLTGLLLVVSAAEAKNSLDLGGAGMSARQVGMGRAATAVSDDVNAVFSNPAGLGTQRSWGLTSMTTKLMDRVEYKLMGGVYPTEYGTFGIGYMSASTPAGYLTSTDEASLNGAQAISYGSSLLILSYGKDLSDSISNSGSIGKLAIGASIKSVSNQFSGTDGSGSGTSADLGLICRPNDNLSGGITFQNVGGSLNWKNGTKEEMPMTTRIGGALNLAGGKASAAADIEFGGGASLVHSGVEYRPYEMVALRAGVDQAQISQSETVMNLTGGVGVKMSGFSFDYAYRQDNGLAQNSTSYFSISFQPVFGSARAEQAAADTVQQAATNDAGMAALQGTSGIDGVYRVSKEKADNNILKYYQ